MCNAGDNQRRVTRTNMTHHSTNLLDVNPKERSPRMARHTNYLIIRMTNCQIHQRDCLNISWYKQFGIPFKSKRHSNERAPRTLLQTSVSASTWTSCHAWSLHYSWERLPTRNHVHCRSKAPPHSPLCRGQKGPSWKGVQHSSRDNRRQHNHPSDRLRFLLVLSCRYPRNIKTKSLQCFVGWQQ